MAKKLFLLFRRDAIWQVTPAVTRYKRLPSKPDYSYTPYGRCRAKRSTQSAYLPSQSTNRYQAARSLQPIAAAELQFRPPRASAWKP